MAAGTVTTSWAASFCLGCDNQTFGSDYCSQRCHLKDGEQDLVKKTLIGVTGRNNELRYPASRLAHSARTSQLVTGSQTTFQRRRHSAESGTYNISNTSFESSRYEIRRARPQAAPTRLYSGFTEPKAEGSIPSDDSSDCMLTEGRDTNVPSAQSVGFSSGWDIWKPVSQSLAFDTDEILLRLNIEKVNTEKRVWDATY